MNAFIDQPVFPYYLLCVIPDLPFTPHNLPFLSFDLSTVLAKTVRSFCSLNKLSTSHLCIFCWVLLTISECLLCNAFLLTSLCMLLSYTAYLKFGNFANWEQWKPLVLLTVCGPHVMEQVTAVR